MKLVTDSDSSGFASPVVKRDFAERPATPGVIEISELLYHARPAGLVVNTERSAPKDPRLPPTPNERAVNPGEVLLYLRASRTDCACKLAATHRSIRAMKKRIFMAIIFYQWDAGA
jgi:hypothetical protein